MLATQARIAKAKAERRRLVERLSSSAEVTSAEGLGPFVLVRPADPDGARAALARLGVEAEWLDDVSGRVRLAVGEPEANDRILAAFGSR